MPLSISALPAATSYDPAADAAGSADPLGTLGESARLAEVILPGLTARMWRARLLTFAVVAADVADHVVNVAGDDDLRLPARMAFERLYVSALVRCEEDDAAHYGGVTRAVSGRNTARRALRAGDEPLTKQNFIKGQIVNGPCGVMARLARALALLNDDGQVAGRGHDLRSAWARAAGMDAGNDGGEFYRRSIAAVADLERGGWPGRRVPLWRLLADALRPDRIPAGEKKLLTDLLHTEPAHGIRPRFLQLLRDEQCFAVYEGAADADTRGQVEGVVLLHGVRPLLGNDPVDQHIGAAVRGIDAYERFSALFAAAFDLTLWAIRSAGGSASVGEILNQRKVAAAWARWRQRVARLVVPLRESMSELAGRAPFEEQAVPALLSRAHEDAERAAGSGSSLIEAVLSRHERVQRNKRKPAWIHRSSRWTVMPGTPVQDEPWRDPDGGLVHPCRVLNAYSIMRDLGIVKGRQVDAEDDGE